MEQINFENHKFKKSKHKYHWQELAEEMTSWFGTSCYWIFWKFPEGLVRTEFGVCKQEGFQDLGYLLYKLRRAYLQK